MGAVATQATTFNIKNYVGTLFRITPSDAPVVSMIGGLRGWAPCQDKIFTWQTIDNAAFAQPSTAILEGADPNVSMRDRDDIVNACQIFQYGANITYTGSAAVGSLASDANLTLGPIVVQDELALQLELILERAKGDLEATVLHGSYANPGNNSTGRKSKGLTTAITTNAVDLAATVGTVTGANSGDLWTLSAHGLVTGDEVQFTAVGTGGTGFSVDTPYWVIRAASGTFQVASSLALAIAGTATTMSADTVGTWTLKKMAKVTKGDFDKLLRTMFSNGAPFRQPVIVCNAFNKQAFSSAYGYAPQSRTVGGLNIQTIETDVGSFGIVLDRHCSASKIVVADLSVLRIRALPIPGKGVLFFEQLAHTGAYELWQLYGELGLEYGPETWHGQIIHSTTDEVA